MIVKVDKTEIQRLTNNLRKAHRSAYPLAVRSTLDRQAFLTKKTAVKHVIPNRFTIRKKSFTNLTIGNQRSKNTFLINKMASFAGQYAMTKGKPSWQYEKQEVGGEEKPAGK